MTDEPEVEVDVEPPWWEQHYVVRPPKSYDELRMHMNIMHATYANDIDLKTKAGKDALREGHKFLHDRPAPGHISHEHR